MGQDKLHQQLAAIVGQLQELCAAVRQNTVLSKNNALLMKRYTVKLKDLLVKHGIEKCPDVVEENVLLVDQNVILIEQREYDVKSLLRLQEKLDELQASHKSKSGATVTTERSGEHG